MSDTIEHNMPSIYKKFEVFDFISENFFAKKKKKKKQTNKKTSEPKFKSGRNKFHTPILMRGITRSYCNETCIQERDKFVALLSSATLQEQ